MTFAGSLNNEDNINKTNSNPCVKIQYGKYSYAVDIGIVTARESHNSELRLINQTSRILKVSSLKTSCGCVAAKLTSDSVLPAQEISVNLRILHEAGKFQKSVTLDFGEKESPVTLLLSGEAMERFRSDPSVVFLSAKQPNLDVVMVPQFENSLRGASAVSLGDLIQVAVKEASLNKLVLNLAIRNPKDFFWRGANTMSEPIEIIAGGRKYLTHIRVDSAVESSVFPRNVSINSSNPTTQLTVFRRSNVNPKEKIRLRIGDDVAALGVLKNKKESSSLSRFEISIVATMVQKDIAEAIVEESDDGETWTEIGVVLCSNR